jgi:hypothetical protein
MIPNGSVVTYVGTWAHSAFVSANSVVAEVNQALTAMGLSVRSWQVDAGVITTLGGPFGVTLQLQVENGLGFDKPDDVISIVRHAVYQVTGDFPSADSLPFVQVPGSGPPQPTGQPKPGGTAPVGCVAGTAYDTAGSFSLSCWWENLTQKGLASVGLLALVAVVGIGIFVFASRR